MADATLVRCIKDIKVTLRDYELHREYDRLVGRLQERSPPKAS